MAKKNYPEILEKVIEDSDILIEVLDARFLEESRNKEAEQHIINKGKPIIYAINKTDLVNIKELKQKSEHLYPRVFISCTQRRGSKELKERIMIVAKKLSYNKAFVGIIGYPNTGKSSIINLLAGRGVAKASAESGFTKGIKKIRITSSIILIDTPGVIPEKEYSPKPEEKILIKETKLGVRMHDKIEDPRAVIHNLLASYPNLLQENYKIQAQNSEEFLEAFAKRRNFLLKGSRLDLDRAAREILKDWQTGRIKIKSI